MGSNKETALIQAVIARFPKTFGLGGFPGKVFRISLRNSYFRGPGEAKGDLMLYTEVLGADANGAATWTDFAKGTERELADNIVRGK